MKYFGKKSLSSVMAVVMQILNYVVLAVTIVAPIALVGIIFMSTPSGSALIPIGGTCGMNSFGANPTDARDWETFRNLPMLTKLIIIPYFFALVYLALKIIRKTRVLFANFANDIVFNKSNVELISKISKLTIAISILSFSFASLLIGIVLLLVCELIRTGASLQEEIDLTI